VAGMAKLLDPSRRTAVQDFGVPETLAKPLAILLPLAELAVAVAFLPARSAWAASLAAAGLLTLFAAAIASNLARGRRPACRCFGQLHSAPIGWRSVARNGVLIALALAVVSQGRDGSGAAVASGVAAGARSGYATVAVLLVAVAAEAWVILHLLVKYGRLLARLEALERGSGAARSGLAAAGLPVGADAPEFSLPNGAGELVTLRALVAVGRPVLLVFTDPGCAACRELMPEIAQAERDHRERLTVAFLSGGGRRARAEGMMAPHERLLVQRDDRLSDAFGVVATPSAVVVDTGGHIASPLTAGPADIRALIARLVGASAPEVPERGPLPATEVGRSAPALWRRAVPHHLREQELLLLFWDPDCAFCQQLVPALLAWEAEPPAGSPEWLFVSTGSAGQHRAAGLRSTFVRDDGSRIAASFGADGTPMAVAVDAEGRVASELVAGAPAVMALAAARCSVVANSGLAAAGSAFRSVPSRRGLPDG